MSDTGGPDDLGAQATAGAGLPSSTAGADATARVLRHVPPEAVAEHTAPASSAPTPEPPTPRSGDGANPTAPPASSHVSAVRGGEHGLYGPQSVTWRVHADPLMGLAGLRALLLQALHPVAMTALEQHTHYPQDPWHRLADIAEYVAVTTFGTTAEAMLRASQLRAVHASVRGTTAHGVPYAADDPQLLAWVHCCFVASFLELTTRAGLGLTSAEQDAYIAEQVTGAMLVGLEPDEVPHDRAQLVDYFKVIRPLLECSPAARHAADVVIHPPVPRLGLVAAARRPAWASVAGLAFATLPPWARRLYAIPELPGAAGLTDAAATVGLRTVRTALRGVQVVVPSLRHGPTRRVSRPDCRLA